MTVEDHKSDVARDEIVAVAKRLFEQHGYTETSLAQIAQAASISLEYLYSMFPVKADLVWAGIDDRYDRLVSTLREHRGVGTVGDALRAALRAVLEFPPSEQDTVAANMETLDRTKELYDGFEERLASHKQAIIKFIADELGQAPDDYAPMLVGETVWAASVTTTRHWVTYHDIQAPLFEAVDAAVAPIVEGYADLLERPR